MTFRGLLIGQWFVFADMENDPVGGCPVRHCWVKTNTDAYANHPSVEEAHEAGHAYWSLGRVNPEIRVWFVRDET